MRDVVVVGAARTPIGGFQGALASLRAQDLGAVAIKEAIARGGVGAEEVSEVYMGCVLPAGLGQAPARQAALAAGISRSTPCTTVNKVCGSGLKTVLLGAQAIAMGDADLVVAGGMESMSNTPYYLQNARAGMRMGHQQVTDGMIHDGLWDPYNNFHMGSAAELCARDKGLTREAQDAFAAESHRRAWAAQQAGAFRGEIVPVEIAQKKGPALRVDTDEGPRADRGDVAKLASLKPAFEKTGTVTAGNASTINDGAAAVLLAAREVAEARGLPILGRVASYGQAAQAPEWFTTAPAVSIQRALDRAGWSADSVDLWEINEAFAVVSLVNNQLLGLDAARVNVNGGAIALGHPIGASGTRLLVTLLSAMAARGAKRGGVSLCIGGGEGIALMVERA
jgi:acetyl-CoA C-acetyltransferase